MRISNPRLTGAIWAKAPEERERIVHEVCDALGEAYGRPRLGNPEDPLDDLVFTVVSNKTSPGVASQVYYRIKRRFNRWHDALAADPADLKSILRPAGLSTVKSEQVRGALSKIERDFGSCDLLALRERPREDVVPYLTSLPGVSLKVAKCVAMYTMGAQVLPVDAHVHRIAKRLGWTARKRADCSHEELEALVPADRRYSFHVDCIAHGRAVCRPSKPACSKCCISIHCSYQRITE